ncbi:EVE domain-containing protein [Janthinobacterium lividum]|uniref:EVE domain-containing protein n=1 Tax=Janthinobacterium lividum TaxID=29581 RepID=A0ABU0XSK1_9BURK|nr:EVE domain-containing protein [Janthinobacterium lividum]MDQ4626113.1 EVE domain-containing protein [Janthinobacterium lividum]MDQ4674920.1 EVE domain-containing protein [Janthinobacterium lividum]MDQ4685652.1 EVE domain-containing protein [Janthinobacterium lividum]
MRYWLLKSEPDELSIDDVGLSPEAHHPWTGVRNYQARNYMRDQMAIGDLAFFYHSSCKEPGIAGVVEVTSGPYPDPTQFDSSSKYYDARATLAEPRWFLVDVKFRRSTKFIPLVRLREVDGLENMRLLAKGSRLSITPVAPNEWGLIEKLLG